MAKTLNKVITKIKELRKQGVRIYKGRKSNILFITGCTKDKRRKKTEMPAYERYKGSASKAMLEFFEEYCAPKKENRTLDLYIMSAGYGFIPADKNIQWYNVTFAKQEQPWMNASARKKMAEELNIAKDFKKLIGEHGYKLIVIRLGPDYISALNSASPEGYSIPKGTQVCYLRPKSSTKRISFSSGKEKVFEIPKNVKINGSYQSRFWSEFFEKNTSTGKIIKKINNAKNVKDLLK